MLEKKWAAARYQDAAQTEASGLLPCANKAWAPCLVAGLIARQNDKSRDAYLLEADAANTIPGFASGAAHGALELRLGHGGSFLV
jgi:hypothetical protein